MNTEGIDRAFKKLINTDGIHKKLKVTAGYIRQMRYRTNTAGVNTSPVKVETKIKLLQRTGWRQDDVQYTQADLVAAVGFALRQGAAAKEHGAEYLVEKFLKRK